MNTTVHSAQITAKLLAAKAKRDAVTATSREASGRTVWDGHYHGEMLATGFATRDEALASVRSAVA